MEHSNSEHEDVANANVSPTIIQHSDHDHDHDSDTQDFLEMRMLVSLDEASRIIGSKGSTISAIREGNGIRIGISKAVPGCSDRILTASGDVSGVANALGDVIEALLESYNAEDEQDENDVSVMQKKKFPFPFLNHILPLPSSQEIKDPTELKNIGYIRLAVLNNQLSSVIGKQGVKIKGLIEKNGVKIVASKDFLPDSNERILEIQGFPSSIASTIRDIGNILLTDPENTAGNTVGKLYYPHLKNTSDNDDFKTTVLVPESYVGAMLGKQGNRLNSLRKYTHTKIVAARADEPSKEQYYFFTITGHSTKNVVMAESMLIKNLETEMERRQERHGEAVDSADS